MTKGEKGGSNRLAPTIPLITTNLRHSNGQRPLGRRPGGRGSNPLRVRPISLQSQAYDLLALHKSVANHHSPKLAVIGAFTPVLAKHTKHLSLVDILSVGVDRMQRNFEPMRKQVEAWKGTRLPDESAKLVIYRAFVEGELDVPKQLARRVHDRCFNPQIEEFTPEDDMESLQLMRILMLQRAG